MQEGDSGDSKTDEDAGFSVSDRRFWAEGQDAETAEVEERKPSYIEQLEQQLAEKDKQLREYIGAYKKEVVEGLEQTKERLSRDAEQQRAAMQGEVAMPMLEVLEALERSIVMGQQNPQPQAILEGVHMVHMLMVQKFKELGLDRIETVGTRFDPNVHEAVAVAEVNDPQHNNVVVEEFSPGFRLGERVVRPARVQVGKFAS